MLIMVNTTVQEETVNQKARVSDLDGNVSVSVVRGGQTPPKRPAYGFH